MRTTLYYGMLIAVGMLAWRHIPKTRMIAGDSLGALFLPATQMVSGVAPAGSPSMDSGTLVVTVALAMIAAGLLALPVAWVYTLTRSRRGYQQSVVQLLVVLPVVVAGIVVLVKYSVALAFSLGGIAAAVRFRNTLDDSKDAVYVFLVIGIGIAAAVDLPVALVISLMFNVVTFLLWTTDFARTPVALEGRLAERRLERARELARTGTFVARIDDEVLKEMTAEQLEGVAKRAWMRARQNDPDGAIRKQKPESRIVVRLDDVERIRPIIELQLEESTKRWSVDNVHRREDGKTVIEYVFVPKKSTAPDELIAQLRASGGADPVEAELQ
ncbi:MAG TPA: DUF4956 domain-containing protein [Gemmatimonadaceae bacterium]